MARWCDIGGGGRLHTVIPNPFRSVELTPTETAAIETDATNLNSSRSEAFVKVVHFMRGIHVSVLFYPWSICAPRTEVGELLQLGVGHFSRVELDYRGETNFSSCKGPF